MTKRQYMESKGVHIYGFNLDEEVDEDFKTAVDRLVESYEEMYNEDEDREV